MARLPLGGRRALDPLGAAAVAGDNGDDDAWLTQGDGAGAVLGGGALDPVAVEEVGEDRRDLPLVQVAHLPDEPESTRQAVTAAVSPELHQLFHPADRKVDAVREADVFVVAGGVSVGRHDHVKGALFDLGVHPDREEIAAGEPVEVELLR